jgi:hypothetical protein
MASFREDGSRRTSQFLCVGGGSEEEFNIWEQITVMGDCGRKGLNRSGAGWAFDAHRELFGSVMEAKGHHDRRLPRPLPRGFGDGAGRAAGGRLDPRRAQGRLPGPLQGPAT